MESIKEINIKNRTYSFFNDMINIKNFDSNLLKIDKKSYKNIDTYYIGYITIKKIGDYENIYSVNPLCPIIGKVDGYIEESNGNKCLVLAFPEKNIEVLTKYTELWDEIKYLIKTINGCEAGEYEKDFMKIRFESEDNLPLNKTLKLHMVTVIVRSVFEDGKYYPQIFLDECLYELQRRCNTIELIFLKELTLTKQERQKRV